MQIVLSDNAGMAGFLDDLNRVHPDGVWDYPGHPFATINCITG